MSGAAGRKAKHDLWLDAGFGQAEEGNFKRLAREVAHGAFVDITPDRRIDAIFLPDRSVGETDFAADGMLAPRLSLRADGCRDVVGVLESKVRIGF